MGWLTTLRRELTKAGFNFDKGTIIYQEVVEDIPPGDADDISTHVVQTIYIDKDHKILDKRFNCDFGAPNMPRFVADDGVKIYFPVTYDGATSVAWIYKDISLYVTKPDITPYPGGG
jgi:hypothetical protein